MSVLPVLFTPAEQGLRQVSDHWYAVRDGDPIVLSLFRRHYSCHPKRDWSRGGNNLRIGGPAETMFLTSGEGDAIFARRKSHYRQDRQVGVECNIFRNEGAALSSVLIREAMGLAWARWAGERLFTFVNPAKIRSANPGCCFKKAGWRRCGVSRKGLIILEALA